VATTTKSRGLKFLVTRIVTSATAVGLFVSLWAGVAMTAAAHNSSSTSTDSTASTAASGAVEQDGWRWEPASQQWVAIAQPTAEAAAPVQQPVIVIERQPVYYTTYVQQVPAGSAAAATAANTVPFVSTDTGSSSAALPSAPASAPSAPAAPPAAPKPAAPPPAPKTTKAS